jgi:hypothetical protein
MYKSSLTHCCLMIMTLYLMVFYPLLMNQQFGKKGLLCNMIC